MNEQLMREVFTPSPKSSIIERVEYSYFFRNGEIVNERIMIWFCNTVSFNFLQVEYIGGSEVFSSMKKSNSIGKFWYKEIKDKLQYKIIVRK